MGGVHPQALRPYDGEKFAGRTLREKGGITYTYTRQGVRIEKDGEQVEAMIAWMFGGGRQAMTPVLQWNGEWVEHRVSWYRGPDKLSLTPGHSFATPPDAGAALGVVQGAQNAQRCFGCHRTGDAPGVQCAACHDPQAEHPAKASRGVALCAQCHRSPSPLAASRTPEIDDPMSVRFAPVGLQASRCFSSGALTCVSCHDPHQPAKADVDAVCQGCHRPKSHAGKAMSGCASCHMPKASPAPFLEFTDHRIR
jgi:hypothetical protein